MNTCKTTYMTVSVNDIAEYNILGNYLTYLNKPLKGPYAHRIDTIVFPLIVVYDNNFNCKAWQDSSYASFPILSTKSIPVHAAIYPSKYPEFFI